MGEKYTNKKHLIGVSICAVVLLVLGSLSNVVGYQSVQSSNQQRINEEVNQKELLFQTIVDIANNKDIQRIVIKSQISREGLFNPDARFSVFNTPVLTKNQLIHMYLIGLMLSKIISKSRMHSIVVQNQLNYQAVQKEIIATIEKDAKIKGEITQLSSLKCDCGNENISWNFPVICWLLAPIVLVIIEIQAVAELMFHWDPLFFDFLLGIMITIGKPLNCFWMWMFP